MFLLSLRLNGSTWNMEHWYHFINNEGNQYITLNRMIYFSFSILKILHTHTHTHRIFHPAQSSKLIKVVGCWMCWHDMMIHLYLGNILYEYDILSFVAKWCCKNVLYEMEFFYRFHIKIQNGKWTIRYLFSVLNGFASIYSWNVFSVYGASVFILFGTTVHCAR